MFDPYGPVIGVLTWLAVTTMIYYRIRENILSKVLRAGATSPETAVTPDKLNLSFPERRWFSFIVRRSKIIEEIDGRYYVASKPGLKEKTPAPLPTADELYDKLEKCYIGAHGTGTGTRILKRKIQSYMKQGLNHEEAIRKVAQDEGYR